MFYGYRKITTFVDGLGLGGMTAQVALDGTMQEAACLTQIEQMLMSTLWPGDFVVMDILPATLVSLLPMPSAGPVRNCASFRPKARTLADRAKNKSPAQCETASDRKTV